MLRAGMVRQASAGIYSWLPLGFRVLKKIEQVVREEQDAGRAALELLMPTIQAAEICGANPAAMTTTARRCCASEDRHEPGDACIGPTNEELITDIFRASVKSYRDLPRHSLPHPMEVPGRSAAALWDHARARIPDEGRLLLRLWTYESAEKRAYNKMFVVLPEDFRSAWD